MDQTFKHFCKKCKYSTNKKYNFNKHCETKKHMKKILRHESVNDPHENVENVEKKRSKNKTIFVCEYCNCSRAISQKTRHYSKCKFKKETERDYEIEELRQLTDKLQKNLEKNIKYYHQMFQKIA